MRRTRVVVPGKRLPLPEQGRSCRIASCLSPRSRPRPILARSGTESCWPAMKQAVFQAIARLSVADMLDSLDDRMESKRILPAGPLVERLVRRGRVRRRGPREPHGRILNIVGQQGRA